MLPQIINGRFKLNGRYFELSEQVQAVTALLPSDFGYTALDLPIVEGGALITVPAGFVTDFASVPQLIWSVIPPIGKIAVPALIHDYLYSAHPAGRKWADAVLRDFMRENGANWLHRHIVWAAVRVCGRKFYDADRSFNWEK